MGVIRPGGPEGAANVRYNLRGTVHLETRRNESPGLNGAKLYPGFHQSLIQSQLPRLEKLADHVLHIAMIAIHRVVELPHLFRRDLAAKRAQNPS